MLGRKSKKVFFLVNMPSAVLSLSIFIKGLRYYKSIGLGFKTPKEAIEGNYVDKKCPFTGNVSIRGRILKVLIFCNFYFH